MDNSVSKEVKPPLDLSISIPSSIPTPWVTYWRQSAGYQGVGEGQYKQGLWPVVQWAKHQGTPLWLNLIPVRAELSVLTIVTEILKVLEML